MFTIREGVFETNSSSTHAIALNPKSCSKYEAKFYVVNSENKIQVRLGRYGWGYEVLYSSDEKLSYIMTMLVLNLIDFGCSTLEDVYDSEMFKEFHDEIVKNTDYAGIEIIDVDPNHLDTGEFYIDHQSYYGNYKKFLEDYNLTLFEYLFNSQYFVITDNDNR